MGEFRIGRTRAQHVYPNPQQAGGPIGPTGPTGPAGADTALGNHQTWRELPLGTVVSPPSGGPVTDTTNTIQALVSGTFLVNASVSGAASDTTNGGFMGLEWSTDAGATWVPLDVNNPNELTPLLAGIPSVAVPGTSMQVGAGLSAIVKLPGSVGNPAGVKFRIVVIPVGGTFSTLGGAVVDFGRITAVELPV